MKTKRFAAAAVAVALAIGTANAAFDAGMDANAIRGEITTQINANGGSQSVATLQTIAAAAFTAGLSAQQVTAAMIAIVGNDADAITALINAALAANMSSSDITAAARAAGASESDVNAGLLASNATPTAGLGGPGSGPGLGSGSTPGVGGGGGSNPPASAQ